MFLRLFLYRLKSIFLQKDLTFWTLAFPLILGTFFYLGFGRLLNGTELELNTIPAAVVTVHENTAFETVLKEVEKSDGKALFRSEEHTSELSHPPESRMPSSA